MDDELARLRDELEQARGESERNELRRLEAEAENERLRAEAAAAGDAVAAFDADVSAMRDELTRADERLRDAAERYRRRILEAEPWLTPDLVSGETLDEIDAAVERARDVAARVRAQLETQAGAPRVPAGAPPRTGPDLSHMTPEQKIRHGLSMRGQG